VPWIAQACSVPPRQASRIASRSVSNNMFRALDELHLLRPSSSEMLRCSGIVGIENLDVAIAQGKGVILLTGHFFANRIAGRYLAANGYAVLSVHNRRPSNQAEGRLGSQFLQPRSIQLQESAYPDSVYIQDPDCSLKIMRRLRAGGLVIFKLDGRGATKVIEQVFLGVPWRVPSGVFEIIRLSDCAVVPMLCLGRSTGFRIRFDPMLPVDHAGSRDDFVSANLPRFLSVVEEQITENPEHWRLWNHF
jgi:Kdo2-lipid IVA lauroyltransferase/acyltransferase